MASLPWGSGAITISQGNSGQENLQDLLDLIVEGATDVVSDPDELGRVIENLVSNAVKFSPDHRAVRLTSRRDGDTVRLRCADDGLAISELDRRSLFTEFFRGPNPTTLQTPGTKLALSAA